MVSTRARLFALVTVATCLGCGATDVLVGDAPGLARIVAGMPGVVADFSTGTVPTGDAITVPIGQPAGVAANADGSFYFADQAARRVGFVSAAGVLSWPVGKGQCGLPLVDRDPLKSCLGSPQGLALEAAGTLLITDPRQARVLRYDPTTLTLTVAAGIGAAGVATDGSNALNAPITSPTDVAVGADGSFYIVETQNHRVLRVRPDGLLFVVAGDGTFGNSGDGGPARAAQLTLPEGIACQGDTLYIADTGNARIRRVIHDTIQAYAGAGAAGFSGDGHSVSLALLDHPGRLVAAPGLLFVADRGNHRVRLIRTGPDSITTFSGTGTLAPGSDLQEAGRTPLNLPSGMAVAGRAVFIADGLQYVIRRVVR